MKAKKMSILTVALFAAASLVPTAAAGVDLRSTAVAACVAVNCTQIDEDNQVQNCGGSGNVFIISGNDNEVNVCGQDQGNQTKEQ